jgi:hypothetical protein
MDLGPADQTLNGKNKERAEGEIRRDWEILKVEHGRRKKQKVRS